MSRSKCKSLVTGSVGIAAILLLTASAPTTGDYANAITFTMSNNAAQQAVQQINQILCIINNSGYSNFTNQGPTLAMVDQNMCNNDGNQGQQANGSNSAGAPNYMNIIFNATRANSNAPESAEIWVTGSVGGGNGQSRQVTILGQLTVTASPTTTNPYGLFEFDFAGYPVGQIESSNLMMKGYIRSKLSSSGVPELEQYISNSDGGGGGGEPANQTHIIGSGILNGYGVAVIPGGGNMGQPESIAMAYNANNLVVQNLSNSNQTCYNRNSIESLVYQYGVFKSDGSTLVSDNSGYPLIYHGQQGFYSYYGVWLPNQVMPVNGDSVTYMDAGGTQHSGTFVVESGLMQEFTPQGYKLSQLAGVQMSVMQPQQGGGGMGNPTNDLIAWDSTSGQFNKVGTQVCSFNGCNTVPLESPIPYGEANFESIVQSSANGAESAPGTVQVFLNGLGSGGNTQFKVFDNCHWSQGGGGMPQQQCSGYDTPSDNTSINVWGVSNVAPNASGNVESLYCVTQCPYESDGQWMNGNPGFDGSGGQQSMINTPYIIYSYDPVNYTLTIDSGPYVGQNIVITESTAQPIMTGPLLTESQYTAIGGVPGSTTPPHFSKIFDGTLNQYLQWQTSTQSFNHYTAITDGGSTLAMTAPLQLIYQSSGSNYFLQYAGVGNLQGIPGVCYSESGAPLDNGGCGSAGSYWQPSFTIPTGSSVTDINGNIYWIKQLFVSQQMDTETGGCSALSSSLAQADSLALPDLSTWTNPTSQLESMPVVTTVSVINGVVQ